MRPTHSHSGTLARRANLDAAEKLGIALKACLQAPMSEPQTATELIQQGLVHHRAGQISLAMDRYTEVLRNDPRNADALYYIAVIACHERQYQQGIDLARRSLSFRPRQGRAHNLIGQALHRMGKIKDALESFNNAIECDANFTDAYSNRANMLSELGRSSEALSSFDRALALNPNSARDWLNRGATLHGTGRPAEAVASYDKAIALDPDFCISHCNRAHALCDLDRDAEALAAYDRAIALEPKMAEAYLGRALALKKLSRRDEALASVDKAIDIKPDVAKMHEARASLLRSLGRNVEADAADTLAAELAIKNLAENSGSGTTS
jgi:tetratricopeptide (TPR) repeat protein